MKYLVYRNKKSVGVLTQEQVDELLDKLELSCLSVMAVTEKEEVEDGFLIHVKNSCAIYKDFYYRFKRIGGLEN